MFFTNEELSIMQRILQLHETIEVGKDRLDPDCCKPEFHNEVLKAREEFLKDYTEKYTQAKAEFFKSFKRYKRKK